MATTTSKPPAGDETAAEIGDRRRQIGLTQTALATLAGCSLAFLGNLEHGYVPRRSPTLERILEVLSEQEREHG